MAVGGYGHTLHTFIATNGRQSASGFTTGCAAGNSDRVVMALGSSILQSWESCEREFPAPTPLHTASAAAAAQAVAADSPRSRNANRTAIDERVARYMGDGLDIVEAKRHAKADVVRENRDARIASLLQDEDFDLDASRQIARADFPSPRESPDSPIDLAASARPTVFDTWKEFILSTGPSEGRVDAASISHDAAILHSTVYSLRFAICPTTPQMVPSRAIMPTSTAVDNFSYGEFQVLSANILRIDSGETDDQIFRALDINGDGVLSPYELLIAFSRFSPELHQHCMSSLFTTFEQFIGVIRMPRVRPNPSGPYPRLENLVEVVTAFSAPVRIKSQENYNRCSAEINTYMLSYKAMQLADKNLNDFLTYLLLVASEIDDAPTRVRFIRKMTVALYQQSEAYETDEGGNLIGYLKARENELIRQDLPPGNAWVHVPDSDLDGGKKIKIQTRKTRKTRKVMKILKHKHKGGKKTRIVAMKSKKSTTSKKNATKTRNAIKMQTSFNR